MTNLKVDLLGSSALRRAKVDQSNGLNCTGHIKIIDKCSTEATYSYTSDLNKYPANAGEMKASCDRINEGIKCLKLYGKCLKSVAKRSLSAYANARSKHSRKLCANLNDPKTIEFYKAAECVKTKNKIDIMVLDEREIISSIQYIALNVTMKWDERLHQACCAASVYRSKVLKDIEPECAKFKDTTEEMLNSMVGELLESACPEQNKLNELCPKLTKLNLAKDWKAVSLTGASLDLIISLTDSEKTN